MPFEWCPKCQKMRNMNMSIIMVEDSDNKKAESQTKNYYCTICNSFIKSEKLDKQNTSNET